MTSLNFENILYGGDVTTSETFDYRSIGHFILEKFKSFDNLAIMVDAISGQEYSAKTMYDKVVRLVYVLKKLNIKPGDVIGLCSENSFEFAVTLFAGFCLNAVVAPLNVTYSERELQHAINLSKPKIFFASKLALERVAKVVNKNNFIKTLVTFGDNSPTSYIKTFKQLMESKKIISAAEFNPPAANKQDDVSLIVCSSGTTGMPKGVQLTQSNILCTLDALLDPTSIQFSNIHLLTVIPWFHSFGCLTLIASSVMGTTLVYLPKFEENIFLGAIEKYKVMMAFMVPPLMVFLAKHPIVDKYDLSSLQLLLCGAAPLSKETEDAIKQRIGIPVIRQGYGLSESTLSLLVQTDDLCKPGSVGALKKGVYCKVIDTETGENLGPMKRGELCFKGDCIMKGYIGDKKATHAIIKNGWLHTGDIGYFDQDFEFFIVDRIKELIKYNGFQVPPAEIEALLLTHPYIKDAAVIGKPDESCGELPMAFVVKQPNTEVTAEDVIEFVSHRASPAKKLRGGVLFIDEIPKNPSGKILRRVLRNLLKTKTKSKL